MERSLHTEVFSEILRARHAILLVAGFMIVATACDDRRGPSAPKIDFHKVLDWPWGVERPIGTAGIDYGAMWCAMGRRDDTPLVAVWFDELPAGQQIGNYRWTPAASEQKQPVRFDSGKVVTFEYRTEAGESGILDFTIDGKEYDLESGRLFLVSVCGDTTNVLQLQRDIGPAAMQFDADSIAATVKTDQEIRKFFESSAMRAPPNDPE